MTSDLHADRRTRPVDRVAVERTRRRLEHSVPAPWLHGEVARRMAERLALMRQQPARVLDAWPAAGASASTLAQALPKARIEQPDGVEDTSGAAWWQPRRWWPVRGRSSDTPPDGRYDMLWANMLLHHVAEPLALMQDWHRALVVDGFLMFSTLGPGTLQSLRDCYRTLGPGPAMAPLVDMHDLGDLLVEAGFADPVMDQELIRLTWRNATEALAELRSLGANVDPSRMPGLRTPRWRQRLIEALSRVATRTDSGRIELEFELVYGHAVKPEVRHALAAETRIGVDDLRRSLRKSRAGGKA